MYKLLFLSAILGVFCLLITPTREHYVKAEEEMITKPVEKTIKEIIEEVAPRFGQDPKLISKISYCESKHKNVSHDGGHGKGVTGIHKNTFKVWLPRYEKEQGETLNYDSSYDQLKLMSWAFSKGSNYRNQWTTYRAYKNGGTYSFYSNLLGKNFIARCA